MDLHGILAQGEYPPSVKSERSFADRSLRLHLFIFCAYLLAALLVNLLQLWAIELFARMFRRSAHTHNSKPVV